jgi:hypothetical protein
VVLTIQMPKACAKMKEPLCAAGFLADHQLKGIALNEFKKPATATNTIPAARFMFFASSKSSAPESRAQASVAKKGCSASANDSLDWFLLGEFKPESLRDISGQLLTLRMPFDGECDKMANAERL